MDHFRHHLTHKDQPREQGQRAREDATFYAWIAQAVTGAARLVIIGRGTGKRDAAARLVTYLAKHHVETSEKIVSRLKADLSRTTEPELLAMARAVLSAARPSPRLSLSHGPGT